MVRETSKQPVEGESDEEQSWSELNEEVREEKSIVEELPKQPA